MAKPKMTTEIDVRIGKKLKRLRRAKEISQTSLGRASNVSFQQIQKYELGQTRITVGRLWNFCEVLGVSPTYFFEGLESVSAGHKSTDEAFATKENPRVA